MTIFILRLKKSQRKSTRQQREKGHARPIPSGWIIRKADCVGGCFLSARQESRIRQTVAFTPISSAAQIL
jgi:hypothetical protein